MADGSLLRASRKAIASLYNNRLSANAFRDPIPKTIDHMIPKVGGATLELGDLNSMVIKSPIWGIEVELFTKQYLCIS